MPRSHGAEAQPIVPLRTLLRHWPVAPARAHAYEHEVVGRYTANARAYHNLTHIYHTLSVAHSLRELARDFAAVQLALWLHDIVYDPRADDNEWQSALFARQTLSDLGLPAETIAHVEALILVTQSHAPREADGRVVVDADLAILGADPAAYDRYARAIRREYAWVPEATYRRGRVRMLQRFLERPRIYHTQRLYHSHERPARRNLQREIATLTPHTAA